MTDREREIARLKESYAQGLIEIDELERRLDEVLAPGWTRWTATHTFLKQLYVDA